MSNNTSPFPRGVVEEERDFRKKRLNKENDWGARINPSKKIRDARKKEGETSARGHVRVKRRGTNRGKGEKEERERGIGNDEHMFKPKATIGGVKTALNENGKRAKKAQGKREEGATMVEVREIESWELEYGGL